MNDQTNALKEGLKQYTERMKEIRLLSSPGIEVVSSADEYSVILRENFRKIGVLAGKNREFISETLDPFLQSTSLLDDETIETVQHALDELLNVFDAENIDLSVATLLTDRLNADALSKSDEDSLIAMRDRQMEVYYLLVNMTMRIAPASFISNDFRKKGFEACDAILAYLDRDKFLRLSNDSREIVLIDSRYASALCEHIYRDDALVHRHIDILERALRISEDPFYHNAVPDFDWKYHNFRIYDYLSLTYVDRCDADERKRIAAYTEKLLEIWKTDPERYREYATFTEIEDRRLRSSFAAGMISREEYLDKLYSLIENRDPYDFSISGYENNVDYPATYIRHVGETDMSGEELKRVDGLYRSIIDYAFRMPKMGMLSPCLEAYSQLLYGFRELNGCITFEDMGIRLLAAFHPPTAVHSRMVARISRCLAVHLMRMRPELFAGIGGYDGEGSITEEEKERIIEYTYHAALCHDFGKLMIIDTIFVYGRKLMDFEFELIKSHPVSGAMLLAAHASTAAYADVAKGHHLWYDCSKGYPTAFNTFESPVKTVIDIVAVADCMDAATDSVGRSYNRGKTLDEYVEEVRDGTGTRYAPWAAALLTDKAAKNDLTELIDTGRMRIYRETYELLKKVSEEAKK